MKKTILRSRKSYLTAATININEKRTKIKIIIEIRIGKDDKINDKNSHKNNNNIANIDYSNKTDINF